MSARFPSEENGSLDTSLPFPYNSQNLDPSTNMESDMAPEVQKTDRVVSVVPGINSTALDKQQNGQETGIEPSDTSIGEYAARLLGKPNVTLHLVPSPDSYEAFQLLERADIRFVAVVEPSQRKPTAEWSELRFEGLEKIRALVKELQGMNAVFSKQVQKRLPQYLAASDAQLREWMTELRKRELAQARAALGEIGQLNDKKHHSRR